MSQSEPVADGKRPRRNRKMPGWLQEALIRDVLIAALVATIAGLISGFVVAQSQSELDDARAIREAAAAEKLAAQRAESEEEQSAQALRLENLRFVRDISMTDPESRQFRYIDLGGMNLSAVRMASDDLTGAALTDTYIGLADFAGATLNGAKMVSSAGDYPSFENALLQRANLDDATFWSANFSGADLRDASAVGTNFDGSDFSGADLRRMDLRGANFSRATLAADALEGACWDDTTIWPSRDFSPPPSAVDLQFCGPRPSLIDFVPDPGGIYVIPELRHG